MRPRKRNLFTPVEGITSGIKIFLTLMPFLVITKVHKCVLFFSAILITSTDAFISAQVENISGPLSITVLIISNIVIGPPYLVYDLFIVTFPFSLSTGTHKYSLCGIGVEFLGSTPLDNIYLKISALRCIETPHCVLKATVDQRNDRVFQSLPGYLLKLLPANHTLDLAPKLSRAVEYRLVCIQYE